MRPTAYRSGLLLTNAGLQFASGFYARRAGADGAPGNQYDDPCPSNGPLRRRERSPAPGFPFFLHVTSPQQLDCWSVAESDGSRRLKLCFKRRSRATAVALAGVRPSPGPAETQMTGRKPPGTPWPVFLARGTGLSSSRSRERVFSCSGEGPLAGTSNRSAAPLPLGLYQTQCANFPPAPRTGVVERVCRARRGHPPTGPELSMAPSPGGLDARRGATTPSFSTSQESMREVLRLVLADARGPALAKYVAEASTRA